MTHEILLDAWWGSEVPVREPAFSTVRMVNTLLIAAGALLFGWLTGFLQRRHRTVAVREMMQVKIDGLQELVALERMKSRHAAETEETSNSVPWIEPIPDRQMIRPARPDQHRKNQEAEPHDTTV